MPGPNPDTKAQPHGIESATECNGPCNRMHAQVMFTLEDFASTKRDIHKYYQIVRAETDAELLSPVFPEE